MFITEGEDVDALALEVFNELNRLSEAEKKQELKNDSADWNKSKLLCKVCLFLLRGIF